MNNRLTPLYGGCPLLPSVFLNSLATLPQIVARSTDMVGVWAPLRLTAIGVDGAGASAGASSGATTGSGGIDRNAAAAAK